jgi:hypothetical protein
MIRSISTLNLAKQHVKNSGAEYLPWNSRVVSEGKSQTRKGRIQIREHHQSTHQPRFFCVWNGPRRPHVCFFIFLRPAHGLVPFHPRRSLGANQRLTPPRRPFPVLLYRAAAQPNPSHPSVSPPPLFLSSSLSLPRRALLPLSSEEQERERARGGSSRYRRWRWR